VGCDQPRSYEWALEDLNLFGWVVPTSSICATSGDNRRWFLALSQRRRKGLGGAGQVRAGVCVALQRIALTRNA
jgi:hypothetical protein